MTVEQHSPAPTVKACTKCGEVKPLDEFHKDKRKRDGRQSRCKECMAEYYSRRYERNREEKLEYSRLYREENPEKIREYSHRYYEENRDELLERARSRYAEHQEEMRERALRYYEENREIVNTKSVSYTAANRELTKALSTVQSHVRWSEEEDALLMAGNGMTVYEKAIRLGRTYDSCAHRLRTVRKLRSTTNEHTATQV